MIHIPASPVESSLKTTSYARLEPLQTANITLYPCGLLLAKPCGGDGVVVGLISLCGF